MLVVALVSGKYPRWEAVLEPVVPGDKQLRKGPRGMFPPGPVFRKSKVAVLK